jgi:hypothetical protein
VREVRKELLFTACRRARGVGAGELPQRFVIDHRRSWRVLTSYSRKMDVDQHYIIIYITANPTRLPSYRLADLILFRQIHSGDLCLSKYLAKNAHFYFQLHHLCWLDLYIAYQVSFSSLQAKQLLE